jgi:type IV pilus assembly protein PilO
LASRSGTPKARRKVIGSSVILFGGFMFALFNYYGFSISELPLFQKEETERLGALNRFRTELNRVKDFQQNIEQIKLRLKELNLKLEVAVESMPKDYDISGLLRRLTLVAGNCNLELNSFHPGQAKREGKDFYETLDIAFVLKGSFTGMILFIDQIGRLKRVLKIQDLKMNLANNPMDREYASVGVPVHTSATVKVFRFVD